MLPTSVLTGVFLYLGFSAIKGNQFLERTALLITDPERVPKGIFPGVALPTVKKYTLLQIASLVLLYGMKESKLGVLFPVIIGGLQFILIGAMKAGWFSEKDVRVLDAE